MTSRLLTLARSTAAGQEGPAEAPGGAEADPEICELCAEPIPPEHRHLLHTESRELLCACRACALLFDREAAGEERYKLIGEHRRRLEGFVLDDVLWEELRIPVDMAFFFHHSGAGRTVAYYPSPMGPTESQLDLSAWTQIQAANPVLAGMSPDVEALLVNRAGGARGHWLVPLDDCYRLVALIRTTWKGLGGGSEVWGAIDDFFTRLDRQARAAPGPSAAGRSTEASNARENETTEAR